MYTWYTSYLPCVSNADWATTFPADVPEEISDDGLSTNAYPCAHVRRP